MGLIVRGLLVVLASIGAGNGGAVVVAAIGAEAEAATATATETAGAQAGEDDAASVRLDGLLGPYAVGFRSRWVLDAARDYDTLLPDGARYVGDRLRAPRPVLVNLWYPSEVEADATRMPHGGYFVIDDVEASLVERSPRLSDFAKALSVYARDVFVQQLFGAAEDTLETDDAARLADVLGTPTPCVRDALPAPGRFAVLLYHAGYGSSFEDNARLCELLASHGYVVLGSAFPRADGSSFNIDGSEDSQLDLDVLVRHAATLPFADVTRLAMAGHSGGAHVTLERAARPHTALDACVVLDTTQDGNSVLDPRWKSIVDACLAHVDEVDEPLLVATRPFGIFELLDQMVRAERDYLSFRDLDHDDFISQGVQIAEMAARRVEAGAIGDEQDDRGRNAAEHLRVIRRNYAELCEAIVAFLDAHLQRAVEADAPGADASRADSEPSRAFEDVRARWLATPLGGDRPHLEHVPVGVDGPDPYVLASIADGPLPTPRQFRRVLDEHGAEVAIDVLRVAHAREPDGPLCDIVHDTALLYELAAGGRDDDARAIGAYLHASGSEAVSMLVAFARVYGGQERYAGFERECLRAALLAAPDDAEAKAAWDALEREEE